MKLFTLQADIVLEAIERDGRCFSRVEYVRKKYGESAPIFLTAYSWYAKEAERFAKKPEGAQLPYWAFRDLYSLDQSGNSHILTLRVPAAEAVFFDMYDWNKILCMRYIGESEREEKEFHEALAKRGLRENEVLLTDFYPEWKREITESWLRLFRHHEKIKAGDLSGVGSVQAGLWQIRKEWVKTGDA